MNYLPFIAAAILAVLGGLHLFYAARDFWSEPRYFAPRDRSLLPLLRATKNIITPNGRDYWTASLGFHFSHSIGVLLFALLIVIASLYQINWLEVLLVGLGAVFTWIAWRCWFHIPLYGCAAATTLMLVGWSMP